VMTPWLVRTVEVYGGWVGIAPSAHHLWRGNSDLLKEAKEGDFSRDKYDAYGSNALERDRYALRKGIENIRSEQPYWILKKGITYLRSWAYDRSFPQRHMDLGLYRDIPPNTRRFLVGYIHFAYLAVMLGAILGLCWTAYRPEKWLLAGLLLAFSAVYIVTISNNTRLRLPLETILIMFSAEGFLLLGGFATWTRNRRRQCRGDDRSSSETPAVVRTGVQPERRKVLLRASLYCLLTAIFIYSCSTNVIVVARRLLP